ncbi:hypothetical protein GN956_G14151 [Arapaima gigas]
MSDSGPQVPPQQDQFSHGGSEHTTTSRHPYLTESITSKHVSFYKSGDPQFRALRMVVNNRMFKTFDALLDSLSRKVPLPFGVRNITTPHGVHAIHTLEELEDGKSYICSDQKKVKPFNLEMASRKLPPWYHARPVSARRRAMQLARRNVGQPTRWDAAVAMRTPKRLTVFQNGDPRRGHTVILQRKTTPTFESLLDYVSELLQFHVVKLHTPDGRRVDGLAALILCSGVVVATGREHFKPGNYDVQKPVPTTRLSAVYNQMKRNRLQLKNRDLYDFPKNPGGSMETATNNLLGSLEAETCTEDAGDDTTPSMLPDDDIEKSFRINQDGSMTVEMKVRLTIKEEELVHWTTTLSRTSVANQLKADCDPETNPRTHTPESNVILAKGTGKEPEINGYEPKQQSDLLHKENRDPCAEELEDTHNTDVGQLCWKRVQTPGGRSFHIRQASVESIHTKSETEIQEDTVGTYACMGENTNGEVAEEYCMVRQHCSRPIPKPRKFSSVEVNNNGIQSSFKSSSTAEVLRIKDNGEEISETMLYISEQQSYNENFFANTQFRTRSQSMYGFLYGQQSSSGTAAGSSSSDSDVELQRPYTASESFAGRKADNLSLPSDHSIPSLMLSTNVISYSNMSINYPSKISFKHKTFSELGVNKPTDSLKVQFSKSKTKKKHAQLSKSSNKKRKDRRTDMLKKSKKVKTDILGHTASEKWLELSKKQTSQQSSERKQIKKANTSREGMTSIPVLSENTCTPNIENSVCSEKVLNLALEKHENLFNMNTKETPVSLSKNVLDVLPPFESTHIRKVLMRQRSMHEDRRQKREIQELNESVSMPDLHSSAVSKYVEYWLEKIQPEPAPYIHEENHAEVNMSPKLILQKGCEEENSQESNIKNIADELDTEENLTCEENITKKSEPQSPTVEMQDAAEMKTYGTSVVYQTSMPKPLAPRMTEQPDMRSVLEKLCQSIQAIRQNSQNKRPSCLEKSNSLPDLSSHVMSTFGSSSKMLLAFLSILTTNEGICNLKKDDSDVKNAGCTEALKMMEALKKIASIEDANELKASVTELQRSTSSQVMQSWRAFQALGVKAQNQFLLNNNSDLELSFEPWLKESSNGKEELLDAQDLLQQLGVSETLSSYINESEGDVTDEPSQKSEETDFITESFANQDVHDDSEPNIKEGDSFTKSDLINDLLNGFDEDTDHGIVVNVEMSEKDSFAAPQETSHREAHDTCPQTGTNYAKQQASCAEKRASFVKERSSGIEHYSTFTEKQDRYTGKALRMEDRDNYSQEDLLCTDEQVSYAEQAVGPDQPSSVEEARCKEAKANYLKDNVSQEEEQTSNVEDKLPITEKQMFFETGKAICSEQHMLTEVNAIHSESPPFCLEKRTNPVEEQGSCSEHAKKQTDSVEDITDSVAKHTGQQSSLEERKVISEDKSRSSVESKASWTEELDSSLDKDVNKENQAVSIEDHNSCSEHQDCSKEEPAYYEEQQVHCMEDGKSNGKLKASYKGHQYELELEYSCPENQTGNSENVCCMEDVASCIMKQASCHEQQGSHNEMQISFVEQKCEDLSCHNNKWMICGKEETSCNQEKNAEMPKLQKSIEEWVNCDEKLPSSEEEMDSSEYEKPHHVGKQGSFDEKMGNTAENIFAEQYSEIKEANGKKCTDEETQVCHVESHVSNVNDGVRHIERQWTYMQEKAHSESNRNSSCQVLVSHCSSEQSKVQDFIKGATKVFVKHKKSANEIYCHAKDLGGVADHKKHNSNRISHSAETLPSLADTNRPLSCSLAFSYDSRGSLKKDHEGVRVKMIREMFLAKNNFDQCGHRQLPSPNTSDLSDYRPETSDSGGCKSQTSAETSTESGDDDSGRQSIAKGYVRRTIEKLYGKCDSSVKESTGKKAPPTKKGWHIDCQGNNSVGNLIAGFQEARTKVPTDLSYFNATSTHDVSNEDSQCIDLNAPVDSSAEVQSNKACWLLKDNQLKPKPPGIPGAADTKTVGSGKESVSDDITYSHFKSQHSPLAVISSSDLEELTRPPVPKCTYLNLPNGSDSDPFQDDLSNKMSIARAKEDAQKKDRKPPPKAEVIKSCGERNGILPLAQVEFRMPDNKVHPVEGLSTAHAITTQPSRAQGMLTRPVHEQDSLDMLHLICGEHCPIL